MTVTSATGDVVRDDHGLRLEFVRTFVASIEQVWRAVTDPDELAAWIGTWRGDPEAGAVEFRMNEGGDYSPVRIVECTPPRRLVLEMLSADGPWPLSVELTHADDTTTMVFVHRLAEPYDASGVGPGWQFYLDRLDARVAGRPVPVQDDVWPEYEALADRYPLPG